MAKMLMPWPQERVAASPSQASTHTSMTLAGGAVEEAEEVPEGEAEALDEALSGDADGEEEVEAVEEGEGVSLRARERLRHRAARESSCRRRNNLIWRVERLTYPRAEQGGWKNCVRTLSAG